MIDKMLQFMLKRYDPARIEERRAKRVQAELMNRIALTPQNAPAPHRPWQMPSLGLKPARGLAFAVMFLVAGFATGHFAQQAVPAQQSVIATAAVEASAPSTAKQGETRLGELSVLAMAGPWDEWVEGQ